MMKEVIEVRSLFDRDSQAREQKPFRYPNSDDANWELRIGPDHRFRVFYELDRVNREVQELDIGVNEEDRRYLGGREFER